MNNENNVSLARYRLDQAHECLLTSETILDASPKASVNRAYYCVFHAMRAVLALDNFESKTHKGILNEFRRRYIKSKIFPDRFSKIIGDAFDIRNDSDYGDFFLVDESEALLQNENAKEFFEAVEAYINRIVENQGS